MESSIRSEIKVGIFVIVGLIILLLSILLLGGDQMFLANTYQLKAKFEEVQGLAKGSVVSLAGLPVGNVKNLEFAPGTMQLIVTLDIDQEFQNRITEGSLASVKTQGALGDRYVFIEPGPLEGNPLPKGAEVPTSDTGDLMEVISERSKDLANIVDVINETHTLLKAVNHEGRSALMMQNMVAATGEMKTFMNEARGLVKDLRGRNENEGKLKQSLTHLSNILEKVDRGDGTLGAIVNDPALHDKLMTLLGETPRNRFLKPLIRDTIQRNEDAK